jgi:hypothetical protein
MGFNCLWAKLATHEKTKISEKDINLMVTQLVDEE